MPIPGMRTPARIKENLGAADITFTEEEFTSFEKRLGEITIHGNRTDEDIGKLKYMTDNKTYRQKEFLNK